MIGYFGILLTVILTVYSQLIFKWRVSNLVGEFPTEYNTIAKLFLRVIFDPYIISGYLSAFLVSIIWIFVLKQFQLSYAYAFLSLPFVLVSLFSYLIYGDNFNIYKIIGLMLIVIGVLIVAFKG